MIEVSYNREHYRLTVHGHASAAPKGEDLLCAAATILTRTLAADVHRLKETGALYDCSVSIEDGHAEIQCTPRHKYRSIVQIIYESVITGYDVLAAGAPGMVEVTVQG